MILRAGFLLAGSNVLAGLLNFARNLLLARLLGVEDFGIAATFIVTMAMLEMLTAMSLDRLVVQARDGDDPRLIAALQGLALVRAVPKVLILLALGWPVAWFFGHPELAWAYQCLAAIPLIAAFSHLGIIQNQRRMRFGPMAIQSLVTGLVMLAAVWPLALWLEDFRVALALMVLRTMLTLPLTHLLSPIPYRIAWDWSVVRRALGFGWPLLVNGLLLFLIMQGDRMVIGNQIGPFELGLFSAALTLAMTPSLLAARIARLFFMPLLSRRQDDRAALRGVFVVTMQAMACAGAAMVVAMSLIGPILFHLAYGERYSGGQEVFLWLVLMFSIRLIRDGSSTVAMSCGNTRHSMYTNLVRLVSLPLCFWAASAGWGMVAVVVISTLAEVLSLVLATVLLRLRQGLLSLDRLGLPYALAGGVMALAAWIALDPAGGGGRVTFPAGLPGGLDLRHGASLLLLGGLVAASRELRGRLVAELRGKRR